MSLLSDLGIAAAAVAGVTALLVLTVRYRWRRGKSLQEP